MGVAGQVFDKNGAALANIVVVVKGTLNNTTVNSVTLTGYPSSTTYGPGGYEVQLASSVLNSTNTLTIQLFDVNGNSLSSAIPFTTYASCTQNLILINFSATTP